MARLFFSYSHRDEILRNQLETHLAMLERQGVITSWHDRRLAAGDHVDDGIKDELERADIILLLVSPDFLASEYCYGVEMQRAMERQAIGQARVIPVILRPSDWHGTPFGKLLATPTDGKPVTKWPDTDDAFLEVAKAIRAAAAVKGTVAQPSKRNPTQVAVPSSAAPRSSNLRVRKNFTERDRDLFLDQTFEFIANFFENSLTELEGRNPGLETSFKRIDATRFTAAIYRDGDALARCRIQLGGLGNGITFSHGHSMSANAYNESLSVEVGEQALFLRALGMAMHRSSDREEKLSAEGAAEYYWSLFIEPLQR